MKKILSLSLPGIAFSSVLCAQTKLETSALTSTYKYSVNTNTRPFGIHDPSVVWNSSNKTFYVYGSHYAGAKTTDLRSWTGIFNYYKGGMILQMHIRHFSQILLIR